MQSADEPLFQALASCGLAVKMPMEKLTLDTSGFTYPCFPPKEQLKAVAASGNFHKILGVPIAYSDYVLPQFWAKCKTLHPDHDFFAPSDPTGFQASSTFLSPWRWRPYIPQGFHFNLEYVQRIGGWNSQKPSRVAATCTCKEVTASIGRPWHQLRSRCQLARQHIGQSIFVLRYEI